MGNDGSFSILGHLCSIFFFYINMIPFSEFDKNGLCPRQYFNLSITQYKTRCNEKRTLEHEMRNKRLLL